MRMHHLWAQNGPFASKKIFLENYYRSRLPISPFHCAKLKKKFFQWIQNYEDAQFLGTK